MARTWFTCTALVKDIQPNEQNHQSTDFRSVYRQKKDTGNAAKVAFAASSSSTVLFIQPPDEGVKTASVES